MSVLFRIQHMLNDQRLLCSIGPMIPASFGATATDGPSTSRNIQGNVLFDTGAGAIFIDEPVAERLGLQPLPKKEDLHGLGGRKSVNVYMATLFIPVETVQQISAAPAGSPAVIGIPLRVFGVAELQTNHDAHDLRAANGLPVIGVLGRSFLQFTRFVYDGLTGNLVIEIDESVRVPRKA